MTDAFLWNIPKGNDGWRISGNDVLVKCPECGVIAALQHDVADDGRVSPSLDCFRCSFHKFVRLLDWSSNG